MGGQESSLNSITFPTIINRNQQFVQELLSLSWKDTVPPTGQIPIAGL